jgi:hypothetical protein
VKVGWKELLNERQMQRVEFSQAERWKREHGEDHLITLERMKELAYMYAQRGTFKQAENLFRETLGLAKGTFEVEGPFTLNGLFDLALGIMAQGRVQDARELWEPFIETGKRILAESASASTILGNPASGGEDEMLTRPKSGIERAESLLRSIRKIPPENQSEGANHWLRWSNQETRAHPIQAEDEEGFKDLEIEFGNLQ